MSSSSTGAEPGRGGEEMEGMHAVGRDARSQRHIVPSSHTLTRMLAIKVFERKSQEGGRDGQRGDE